MKKKQDTKTSVLQPTCVRAEKIIEILSDIMSKEEALDFMEALQGNMSKRGYDAPLVKRVAPVTKLRLVANNGRKNSGPTSGSA